MRKPDLSGRVAIVTGSSRGIGREVALALAQQGCNVVVAAKTTDPNPRLPGTIIETRDAILKLGVRALAIKTNLRNEDEIEALVTETKSSMGRIDILVNNAGALWWRHLQDTPVNKFDLLIDVNARASYACAYHCLPHMLEGGFGHIINMSPPIHLGMVPGKVAYAISKFGMTLVAHGLAEEVRGRGVAVNALWPATIVESQASKNFGLGTPANWRKASILSDAVLAIVSHDPNSLSGRALLDEDILREVGVTDFEPYRCAPGGDLIRIAGEGAVASAFGTGAGGGQKAKVTGQDA